MPDDELRIRTSIDNTAEEGLKRLENQARRTASATGQAGAGAAKGGEAPRSAIDEYHLRKARAEDSYAYSQRARRVLQAQEMMSGLDIGAVMGRDARMGDAGVRRDQARMAASLRADIEARMAAEERLNRQREQAEAKALKAREQAVKAEQRMAEKAEQARRKLWGIGGGQLNVMSGMGALFGGMQVAHTMEAIAGNDFRMRPGDMMQLGGGALQMIPIPGFQVAGMAMAGVGSILRAADNFISRSFQPKETDMSAEGQRVRARQELSEKAWDYTWLGASLRADDRDTPARRAREKRYKELGQQIDDLQRLIQDPYAFPMAQANETLQALNPEFRQKRQATQIRRLARVLEEKAREGTEPLGAERARQLYEEADKLEAGGRDYAYEMSGAGARFRRPLSLREVGRAIPRRDQGGQMHLSFDFSGVEGPLSAAVAAAIRPAMERAFGGRRQ